jgi:hypothetical protein
MGSNSCQSWITLPVHRYITYSLEGGIRKRKAKEHLSVSLHLSVSNRARNYGIYWDAIQFDRPKQNVITNLDEFYVYL